MKILITGGAGLIGTEIAHYLNKKHKIYSTYRNSKPKKTDDYKTDDDKIDYSKDPETENMKIENVIDYVATKYITQSDFTELQNLHKSEYCNKLVVLTSKTIKQFLNDIDIEYLDQRTKDGLEINKNVDIINITRKWKFTEKNNFFK